MAISMVPATNTRARVGLVIVMIASIVHGRAWTILAARVPWVRAWMLIRVTAARAARVVQVRTRSVVASIQTSSPAVSTHTDGGACGPDDRVG